MLCPLTAAACYMRPSSRVPYSAQQEDYQTVIPLVMEIAAVALDLHRSQLTGLAAKWLQVPCRAMLTGLHAMELTATDAQDLRSP